MLPGGQGHFCLKRKEKKEKAHSKGLIEGSVHITATTVIHGCSFVIIQNALMSPGSGIIMLSAEFTTSHSLAGVCSHKQFVTEISHFISLLAVFSVPVSQC